MGLDMYAARRLYVKQWDHQSPEERYTVQITQGGKPVPGIQSDRISVLDKQVMYWHKATHIHGWFVDNVMNGKSHYVSRDKLCELLKVCNKVIKASKLVDGTVYAGTVYDAEHPKGVTQRVPGKVIEDAAVAEELLPKRPDFFWDTPDYDERYLNHVVETRDWCCDMLTDSKAGVPGDIYYRSSW